ncbi:NAD(P)/FAD-dependent oxidoreductase [Siccirubricoccus sp. KC 17139]|uniref:NAD(P)/FAD-dependent oxidoreductase n=1 Tax=Siccirubricoccus soli TaxID=2899147 RepID=A0ABT1D5I2_9PROT|nr:NAD(P)/FAD-dependent oxidoreductase [Siccirubricoccus soli]MCO6417186.1 NAD(P)/FAD-dependent oxidoreductase [Siccirubricoccus soli]MCP2683321.1 NAD(P)/FAD-dependent oxidoreductase [Siccirubricoccus soli]
MSEPTDSLPSFDAIIIGAGIAGMYQLYRLRELGLSVQVFEAGSDVGGTWYWNRYPGARFDSESYTYGYSFSQELLQEWNWSEHFAAQPETLRYLNHVADRFELRPHIRFDSRVTAARYDEASRRWEVMIDSGERFRARFLVTAIGPLSADTLPRVPGIRDFRGESFHTSRWPREPVEFAGKRVAVIGTGATGVQVIQTIAPLVGQLTVFQRTPNWCTPLHNRKITEEEQARIKANYPAMFELLRRTPGCYIHDTDPRSTFDVTPEEREAFWEKLYGEPGFGIWMANFRDVLTDPKANALFSDFVARKIRQRVKDPVTAEKLIPKNHGFGTRRVPQETFYYEAFNLPHVRLVDLQEEPIERVTESGIRTSAADYPFDMIIYATGFDAITGSFDRIDIRGVGGLSLKEKWAEGPKTYLGLMSAGFPNMLTIVGPHNASTRCNIPRCIEQNVEWITDLLRNARDRGITRFEATPEAEAEWSRHIEELASGMLYTQVDSWATGVNRNVEGKDVRRILQYQGGAPQYRAKCEEVASSGYAGMVLA